MTEKEIDQRLKKIDAILERIERDVAARCDYGAGRSTEGGVALHVGAGGNGAGMLHPYNQQHD